MYTVISFDKDSKKVRDFINFEFEMYKNDDNWVPPLKGDTRKMLSGKGNPLFANGDQRFFLVYGENKIVGRMLVGIDEELNRVRGFKQGYFSMFECINDSKACKQLLDNALGWITKQGMNKIIGPLSPCNGDDRKGFVVMGEGQPVLLNAYTKDYYPALIEKYGFSKNDDHFAYVMHPKDFSIERHERVVEYAKKRGGYRVDRLDPKKIESEAADIKVIMDNGIPEDWDYLVPPSLQGIIDEFKDLIKFYDGNYCYIVRKGDMPIGFLAGLPDYNQVLKHMKGHILPIGWAKFLFYRRKINGIRAMIQMVHRDYHKIGVNHAMYCVGYRDAVKMGIDSIEVSCVDEKNLASRATIEHAGGKHYRTYRTYKYDIKKA